MFVKVILQAVIAGVSLLVMSACSLNSLSVRLSSVFIEHRVEALSRETDLVKVRRLLPENIKQLESMLATDGGNQNLHIYAAQAHYSYAFAFMEDTHNNQAIAHYYKSYKHAKAALSLQGVSAKLLRGRSPRLKKKVSALSKSSVEALYWTALSWAKLIELKQPDMLMLSQLPKTAILMERVLKLDADYHLGGPYLFFAVYYGGRSHYMGGDPSLALEYFERARRVNNNRLLLVDFLQAKYLNGRANGGSSLNQRLKKIIQAPDNLYPEQGLMNAVAKQKASRLLSVTHS